MATVMAPSCYDQLSTFNMNLGMVTNFDDGRGLVMLTEGNVCWDQVRDSVSSIAYFITEQLAMATGDAITVNDATTT